MLNKKVLPRTLSRLQSAWIIEVFLMRLKENMLLLIWKEIVLDWLKKICEIRLVRNRKKLTVFKLNFVLL